MNPYSDVNMDIETQIAQLQICPELLFIEEFSLHFFCEKEN